MADQEFTAEELATEEWRAIAGYQGLYDVSNLGRVRRLKASGPPRIMHAGPVVSYRHVTLCDRHRTPKVKVVAVHRIVAASFLGECPEGYEINHKDLNKGNARLSNLEYVTRRENMQHASINGRMNSPRRRAQPRTITRGYRLTMADVATIKRELLNGVRSVRLAERFGVTEAHISLIKSGRTWHHVKP